MPNSPVLTRRQQAIFDYLREHQDRFEHPPTLEELCEVFGVRSRGSLHKHIQALVDAGLIQPMAGKQRGVRLVERAEASMHQLPLLGYIAAGQPIEAIETPESIEVPAALRTGRSCYVLEVRGDSMINDGILDGDWVVIEQRDQARNGDVVVALVDGSYATLKRIEQRPDRVLLHAANDSMKPMSFLHEQIVIQGILVGQMRRYQ